MKDVFNRDQRTRHKVDWGRDLFYFRYYKLREKVSKGKKLRKLMNKNRERQEI